MVQFLFDSYQIILITIFGTLIATLLASLIIGVVKRHYSNAPNTNIEIRPSSFSLGRHFGWFKWNEITEDGIQSRISANSPLKGDEAKELASKIFHRDLNPKSINVINKITNCEGLCKVTIYNKGKSSEEEVELFINSLSYAEIDDYTSDDSRISIQGSAIGISKVAPKEKIKLLAWTRHDLTSRPSQTTENFRASGKGGQIKINFDRLESQSFLSIHQGAIISTLGTIIAGITLALASYIF